MIFDVRLFTGLSLPPEMLARMDGLIEELRPLGRIRWIPVSQLHITTKFIGKWPFQRLPELARFLYGMPPFEKFPVEISGLGYFPEADRCWTLYARVEPSDGLMRMAADLDERLSFFNIPRERRAFRPHITIGKIGQNPTPDLDRRVDQLVSAPLGSFEATEYHLFESGPAGYRQYVSMPLADASSTL